MTQDSTTELLAPAGNLEKLKIALAYGADAVYAGVPQFSLRARENGFTEDNIFEGIEYTHQQGKKFYLTANIIAHNRKIKPFINKIESMLQAKPDALIMADPGLIKIIKEKHPQTEIHLSVQSNVMNA
ncbi:U32 family peptidase, partial [bacterium K02(2017)]